MNFSINRKEVCLVSFVVLLAAIYVWRFTTLFQHQSIHIEHTARPLREAWNGNGRRADTFERQSGVVTFSFSQDYKLTSVQVVSLADCQSNKHPSPLWRLTSKHGSIPIHGISYGMEIQGMIPDIPNARPKPLQPDIEYRLIVEAGSLKGTNDFVLPPSALSER